MFESGTVPRGRKSRSAAAPNTLSETPSFEPHPQVDSMVLRSRIIIKKEPGSRGREARSAATPNTHCQPSSSPALDAQPQVNAMILRSSRIIIKTEPKPDNRRERVSAAPGDRQLSGPPALEPQPQLDSMVLRSTRIIVKREHSTRGNRALTTDVQTQHRLVPQCGVNGKRKRAAETTRSEYRSSTHLTLDSGRQPAKKRKRPATVTTLQEKFPIGTVVFAKVYGFAHWPAKVLESNRLKYKVWFYGSHDIRSVDRCNIFNFKIFFTKFGSLEKKKNKMLFAKAMSEVSCG